jgi:catechol 2,3-dioxygenase-like lactoylglutathione lyase family enzyme
VTRVSQRVSSPTGLSRREWLAAVGGLLVAAGARAQTPMFPLRTTGLDHLSMTVPDSVAAATFYGRIFDPQVFHERTGVQRYYVRLGSAYLAFGPRDNVTPFIDHIAASVIDFVEEDFPNPDIQSQITSAGLASPGGALPMLSDPDNLRLQLVSATHGLFDTLMPGGRVTIEPPVLIPMGLDHIVVSVRNVEASADHYRKLFGPEESDPQAPGRVWFRLAESKLGLEAAGPGESPGFTRYGVRVAGFDPARTIARLGDLGVAAESGTEAGTLRFPDLHGLPVEVIAGA